jgi:hypothetical protein
MLLPAHWMIRKDVRCAGAKKYLEFVKWQKAFEYFKRFFFAGQFTAKGAKVSMRSSKKKGKPGLLGLLTKEIKSACIIEDIYLDLQVYPLFCQKTIMV